MRLPTISFTVVVAVAGLGALLSAQAPDALYAGRHCNQELARLRPLTVSDVVDSGGLTRLLRDAADSTSPITKVTLLYDAYGQLSKVKTAGVRSSADADLERVIRAAAKPIPGMPNDFMVTIVRLNRRDIIDLSLFPFTCPPGQSSTSDAARIMQDSRQFPTPPPRDALVQLWLGANGAVADAWILRSAGRSELDSLALKVVRALRYTPPVFGSTPVAMLLQQPVHF